MLALSVPRKPAPMLAMRGAWGRTCLRPKAFGNALGESIVAEMRDSALPAEVRALSADQRQRVTLLAQRAGADLNDASARQVVLDAAATQAGGDFTKEELARRSANFLKLAGASAEQVNQVLAGYTGDGVFGAKRGTVEVIQSGEFTPALTAQSGSVTGGVSGVENTPFFLGEAGADALIGTGRVAAKFAKFVDDNPIAKYSLMALDVAAGPTSFALRTALTHTPGIGDAIEAAQAGVMGFVADRLTAAGNSVVPSEAGGLGALTLLSLGVSGGFENSIRNIAQGVDRSAARVLSAALTGKGTVLARNLREAGIPVPVGFDAHHLIPSSLVKDYRALFEDAARHGYDINGASNGLPLPGSKPLAIEHDLPLHTGRHLGDEYMKVAAGELDSLRDALRSGSITATDLPSQLNAISSSLKTRLLERKLFLQSTDPRYPG